MCRGEEKNENSPTTRPIDFPRHLLCTLLDPEALGDARPGEMAYDLILILVYDREQTGRLAELSEGGLLSFEFGLMASDG